MNFNVKLKQISHKNNSLLCIGLDSDFEKIPHHLKKRKNPLFEFNKAIIEATVSHVCAYKPNPAFYEALGKDGIEQLKLTLDYLKINFPDIPVILDAKRADIGNTNKGYVKYAFEYLQADAITLHPYLGSEALKPFLDLKDKGIFILCRTSNPGAGEFQDLKYDGKFLYEVVAKNVINNWNYNGNCGLVVGATYPEELNIVRQIIGDMPMLLPGVGAQGADLEKTVKCGVDNQGQNAVINSSRNIIFASNNVDFALKAANEAENLKKSINLYRSKNG